MPDPATPELADLQAWLQARVTAGILNVPEDAAGAGDGDVVVESAALPARARLGIYARSYVMRLAECLRAEFPVLLALVGDDVFNLFAGAYLGARPPTSYSLYDLGGGFPDYLDATRPPGAGALAALPGDLARLERAISECGRAPGVEDEPPDPALDAAIVVLRPGARLRTPQSLRLLRQGFDFTAALASVRAGEHPEPPPVGETLIAVARSRYAVRVHRLEPWSFAWLEAVAGGADVRHASATAARVSGRETSQILAMLIAWLPAAVDAGFVAAMA